MVISLNSKAQQIANDFSNPTRTGNQNKEVFCVMGVKPLSESTAVITFMKNTGKLALAFAYFVNAKGGYWSYFFPTESHAIGMQKFQPELTKIDQYNFKQNGC